MPFTLKKKKDAENSPEETIVIEEVANDNSAVTQRLAAMEQSMKAIQEENAKLKQSIEQTNNFNKVFNFAKKFGSTDQEAREIASKDEFTYEQKLETCLQQAEEYKNNVTKLTNTGTAPVGELDTSTLVQDEEVKTTEQAIKVVQKQFGTTGVEAYNKAKVMYPDAFNSRFSKFKK